MSSPSTIEIIKKSQSEFTTNNHNIKNVVFKLLKDFEDSFDRKLCFSIFFMILLLYVLNCRW
jgi:hypothetical protein